MVGERSALYHFRKQVAIWIYPAIAGTFIFLDWNHTRQWKNGDKVSVLDELIGSQRTIGVPPSKQQQKVCYYLLFVFISC